MNVATSFMEKISSVWDRIAGIFQRKPAVKTEHKTKQTRKRRDKYHFGEHYYLGDLLDQLDDVFLDLPRLKKSYPDAYDLYSRIGATVTSSDYHYAWTGAGVLEIEPYFLATMPSVGCYYFGIDDTEEKLKIRFGIIQKCERPINVQPSNHAVYCVTFTYTLKNQAYPAQFHVSVTKTGEVTLLREKSLRRHDIYAKKRRRHQPAVTTMHRLESGFPPFLVDVAHENKADPKIVAQNIFAAIANSATKRDVGLTVHVKKKRVSAAFAIDMTRTPYFFNDREKTVNDSGNTKPIMHIVRGHWRTRKNGDQVFIKPHFRGLREFEWNGYQVTIGLPGTHGSGIYEFNVPTGDPSKMQELEERGEKLLSNADIGDMLRKHLAA